MLERIRVEADFKQNYYKRGEKTGPRPRLEAWYGTWDYTYSGTALKAAPMPDYLQAVIDKITAAGFGDYNAVLINKYRDGDDNIDWHSDDDPYLSPYGFPNAFDMRKTGSETNRIMYEQEASNNKEKRYERSWSKKDSASPKRAMG